MASYRALLKTAGKYDKIKDLFEKVDRGGDSLDYALRDREELYNQLNGWLGYNGDAEPEEYYKMLDKARKMYQYALAAKYLPDNGVLDMNKIPERHRAMLLDALPDNLRDEVALPDDVVNNENWWVSLHGPGSVPVMRKAVADGSYGSDAAKLLAAGKIRTYGDIRRIADSAEPMYE